MNSGEILEMSNNFTIAVIKHPSVAVEFQWAEFPRFYLTTFPDDFI